MMSKWRDSMDAKVWAERYAAPLIEKMMEFKKPLITLVNGLAFGGGMELNILADIVIASKEAVFAIPEALIGAFPPLASSLGVPLVSKKIIRYALTGEWLSAEQCKELGLVDIVVSPDQLEATAAEMVMKTLRAAPLGAEAVKSSARACMRAYKELMRAAVQDLVILSSSQDFIEGSKAFVEKRAPVWKGK
jgi:enoyl-CoA hydratase/carnithine racemase